ncbi:Proteinase inhibitor I20 protein [Dioscorea alata]|uniref:Proteinase inhibitor I20 protein n=1 Tax=Dioscorea alata TaxID=55571 RepID=A0ACB7VS70_DIOAL|nr:Proteinase inhibitor I20 protein [Dioscorea alata]
MADFKLSVALFLLLSGMVLFGDIQCRTLQKICPLYCLEDVKYMTCESSGNEKLDPVCNCCFAPQNCTLHLTNGNQIHC